MLNLFGKAQWAAINAITGETHRIEQLPFEIGSSGGVDLKLTGAGVADRHCAVTEVQDKGLCLVKHPIPEPLVVNGELAEFSPLVPDKNYAVKVGPNLLILHGARHIDAWVAGIDWKKWVLVDSANNQTDGPLPLAELCALAREHNRHPRAIVKPAGLETGFALADASDALAAAQAESSAKPGAATAEIVEENPPLTCPVCWLTFDVGDIMHLATHESLRGDPILGEDAPQRFLATRFNDRGQALDALGLPCTEMACPHCRRVLPPGFIETPHHIISIVGDQSAGKSYYLSVLLKMLPLSLYENFGVVFQDADPAGNALVNEMKQTLFGAKSPEGARLAKTQLEGGMYVRLPRFGRMVALPKPFVFSTVSATEDRHRCSLIFYDNAGEHFQPGRDSVDSPGAQHVASSSGIVFLFDPFNNPDFRREIQHRGDPQLEKPVMDQQSVILSEMKVRIAKLLKLDVVDHIQTPLAVLVGKSDAWLELLGPEPLRPTVVAGRLDSDAVNSNSNRVRALMKRLAPSIVANAESISRRVVYFPVSSFGHAPVRLGQGDYVPDPLQLKPFCVEAPMLWILSLVEPDLVPGRSGGG